MNNTKDKIAKAVWDYKDKMEREEDEERINFNKCYDEAWSQIRKEKGIIKFIFFNQGRWSKVSKRAMQIYKKKYKKDLDDYGDIKCHI